MSDEIARHPLADVADAPGRRVQLASRCTTCGTAVDRKGIALRCRSCGAALVRDSDLTERVRPDGLLPFEIDESAARGAFAAWLSSRRFAPRALRSVRQPPRLDGVFLPFWRFSSDTMTRYLGDRGENKHRRVARTRTNANGQTETVWETETSTVWHPTSGQSGASFSDLLVPACSPLAEGIPSWPLGRATPYAPGSTSGKRVIAYDVEPERGFKWATAQMHQHVERVVRSEIGGDKQRVRDLTTTYVDPTYTLLLVPAWLVHYAHGRRNWWVLINGSSGEVVGDRPYSAAKIVALVAVLLAVLATMAVVVWMQRS